MKNDCLETCDLIIVMESSIEKHTTVVCLSPEISFASPAVDRCFPHWQCPDRGLEALGPCSTPNNPLCVMISIGCTINLRLFSHIYLEPGVPMYNTDPRVFDIIQKRISISITVLKRDQATYLWIFYDTIGRGAFNPLIQVMFTLGSLVSISKARQFLVSPTITPSSSRHQPPSKPSAPFPPGERSKRYGEYQTPQYQARHPLP